ncbi:MAG: hypothetical protein CMI60_13730 [Parvibaculum sp.]|nr:hypothetical protein [Parvibaculum sp.]
MSKFEVTAPTGEAYIVDAPEGATQEQILGFVQQQLNLSTEQLVEPARPDRGLIDAFTSSVGRGIDRAAITLGDELPALIGSALGQDDYARRQIEEAELAKGNLQALNPTQIESYKDINNLGDALIYATESIGENIPNILGIAGGVGATSFAARKFAGSAIKKKLKKETIDKNQVALQKSLREAQDAAGNQAIIPAAFLGSYALNAPEVFTNIYDSTGELAPGAALLTGSMSAALDSILPTAVVKRLQKNPPLKAKVVSELAKKSGMKSQVLGAIGLGAGKGFALEGVTESTQEALSLAAERIVGKNYEALTSPEFERLIDSGLRGGLAGSAFGAAGGTQEGLQLRSAVNQQKQAEDAKKQIDAADKTDAAGAADGTTDAEGVRIQDTTQLQQDELFSSGDAQYDAELKELQAKYDKELEKPQAEVEKRKKEIEEQKAAGRSTAFLESSLIKIEQKIATIEKKRKEAFDKLQKATLERTGVQLDLLNQATDPVARRKVAQAQQLDLFPEQDTTGEFPDTTDTTTRDATTTDTTRDAPKVGTEEVIEDPVVVDPELDFNNDLLVMEASLKNKDQKEVNQSVRFFKTFNNYLKDKGRTYAEFKENLKDSGSGMAAIEKMLGKPEALKFLAGDIYNAVIDSEKFVVKPAETKKADETVQDFRQNYVEKQLTPEKWNKITEGNQTFGNKKETKEYRNTTKIGTKFAREYYNKLSEDDKATVRQDVIDLVVRGSGYRPIVAGGGLGTKKQAKLKDQEKKKIEDLEKKIAALKSQQDRLVFNGTAEEFNAASAKIQDLESKIQSIRDAAEDRAAKGKPRKEKPSGATDTSRADKGVKARAAATTAAIVEIGADTLAARDARAAQLEAERQAAQAAQDKKQDDGLDVGEVVDGESVANNLDEDTTALETNLDAQDVIGEVTAGGYGRESVNIGTIVEPTTVEETVARLSEINIDVTNNERVSITPTPEAAGLDPSRLSSGVKGVVIKDKAYLFTDNIQRGNEVGVFLHEVGAHVGMVNLVGRKNYNFLVNRVKQFAKLNDGSREHDLAKGALAYIQDVENTTGIKLSPEARDHETLAYFVELAVQNGTRPSEVIKQQSKLSVFFKRLLAGIKSILRKYGKIDPKELDAQSIVDLAYGGAQLAIRAPNKKLDFLSSELLFSQATSANALYDMQTKLLGVANDIAYDEKYAFAVDELSKGKDSLSTIFYGALSFDQLMDHANRFNPFLASQIKKLGELVSLKRAKVDDYNRDITQKLLQVTELQEAATSNMPKEQRDNIIKEFNDVTHQSSIDRTDLRKSRAELQQDALTRPKEFGAINFDLVTRFEALPAELQQAYVEVINTYETYGNMLLDQITASLTRKRDQLNNEPDSPKKKEVLSALDKLNLQLQSNRIVPYVPLNRSGEYWIDLEIPSEDGGTEPYTEAFDTRSQAERALNQFKQDKDTTVTREVYQRTSGQTFKDMSGQAQAYQQVLQLLQSIDPPKKADERNEHDIVIEKIVQAYYDSFPSTAIKQHFQRREGVAGYNNDVVQNFAATALKMSNEVANAETSVDINNAIEAIIADSDGKPLAGGEANIRKEITKRAAFLRNPTPATWARMSSAFGYNMYLAGNISSALVNLTQLPLVTYPKLIAEFGVGPATNMMFKLLKQYFKNLASPSIGRDDNTTLTIPGTNASLADVTIFTKDVLKDNGMDKLYTTALQRNLIRRTTSQELQEARQDLNEKKLSRVNSTRDRLLLTANWAFQNSERANREVGIKAAYELAIDKFTKLKRQGRLDKTTEEIQDLAIERALKITEEASGTALQELGPRWFQSNIGKVVGTFKRFVFSQVYLQYKLTAHALGKALPKNHKSDSSMPIDPATGEPVDAQKFAREQLAYITLMATIFAGARGIPGMGVATFLYELGADEDDPDYVSFDAWMKARMGDALHRGPMSHYLNIDMSNRIGFNGLLWRRDDQKMEDLGYLYGTMSQLAGPVVSAADQITRGIVRMSDDSRESPIMDGVQMIMPAAIRNPMKGMRIYINGAVDKAGRPIVEDVSLYNALMQGVGFNPTEIALAYEKTNILYTKQRALEDKRRGLLNRRFFAHYAGDMDGVAEVDKQIREFNNSKFTQAYKLQIGGATKLRSLKMKLLEANKTYQDVVVPEDVRRRASEAMGGLEVDE